MATKADFTEDEWKDLSNGPTGLVLWIASIEPGFMDRVRESWAASQAVVTGASTELQRELAKPAKPDFAAGTLEEQRAGALGALGRSVAILTAKAPDEVEPYKTWIVSHRRRRRRGSRTCDPGRGRGRRCGEGDPGSLNPPNGP